MTRKDQDLLQRAFSFFTIGLVLVALVVIVIPQVAREAQERAQEESLGTQGRVVMSQGLGVYDNILDVKSDELLETIYWGTIRENETLTYKVWIENVWPYTLETVSIWPQNFTPGILSEFFVLDPKNVSLGIQKGTAILLVLELYLKPGIPPDLDFFRFDITFSGSWADETALSS